MCDGIGAPSVSSHRSASDDTNAGSRSSQRSPAAPPHSWARDRSFAGTSKALTPG